MPVVYLQAKGTKSTSFLRNEVDLVSLACEDGQWLENADMHVYAQFN